jgi:23S rRNA pseudouridine2605 synthase
MAFAGDDWMVPTPVFRHYLRNFCSFAKFDQQACRALQKLFYLGIMRLNKYLALCGIGSRRSVEDVILAKRVAINGTVIEDLGRKVAEGDTVTVDGKQIKTPRNYTLLLFHKPPGCLCTRSDPQGRETVYDWLPTGYKSLRTVGRLDLQSRGLLLFTDDGDLAFRLTHPSYEIPRTYQVWTDRPIGPEGRKELLAGVDLGEGEIGKARTVKIDEEKTEITLLEGKNREIRRMMEAINRRVRDLKRISFGPLVIDDLPSGEFRILSEQEAGNLYASVDMI